MATGTTVTITGNEFANASAVSFNNVTATINSVTLSGTGAGDQIVAYVPPGATTGAIRVTTPGGIATSAGNFTVQVAGNAPTISSLSLSTGHPGAAVSIVGTYLTAATVLFVESGGSWSPDSVTISGDGTTITTDIPSAAPAGTGHFTVTTAGGAASSTSISVTALSGSTINVDSYASLQSAYNTAVSAAAGGTAVTLKFSAKTYNVTSGTAIALDVIRNDSWSTSTNGPTNTNVKRSGIITLEGTGTTIKYTDLSSRFCWLQAPNPGTAGDTYGNIVVNGFTFDDNLRRPTANCGTVIWCPGVPNYSNIVISNCQNLSSGVAAAPYAGTLHTYSTKPAGPILTVCFEQSGATGSYTNNITVTGCTLYAQSGSVAMYGNSSRVYDQINQSNSTYDNQWWAGANAMVGGPSKGWRCSFNNIICKNSLDDGIEVDAFSDVTITNCSFTVNRQAICLTRIAPTAPYQTTETIHISGCTYYGGLGYYWDESAWQQPMMPEMRTNPTGVWTGPVVIYLADCSATWSGSGAAHALFQLAGPSSLTVYVHNCTTQGATLCNRSYIPN